MSDSCSVSFVALTGEETFARPWEAILGMCVGAGAIPSRLVESMAQKAARDSGRELRVSSRRGRRGACYVLIARVAAVLLPECLTDEAEESRRQG